MKNSLMKNEQIKSELVSKIKNGLLVSSSPVFDINKLTKLSEKLADEIIILFDKSGKTGKTNTCQCEDSQDSYMELNSGNKPTGKLICAECNKPYVHSENKTNESIKFSGKIILDWEIKDSNVPEFWYWNKLGKKIQSKILQLWWRTK